MLRFDLRAQSGESVMNRRTIIRTAAATLVGAWLSARGQQPDKVWRVGVMGHSANRENMLLFLDALETLLSGEGYTRASGAATALP